MAAIEKITVRGFQSIREPVEVELDRYTAICGPSNIGKSALLRAVFACWTNRRGSGFVNKDCGEASVTLQFADGQKVEWVKSPKSTTYRINGKVYEKSGKAPPEELAGFGFLPVPTSRGNHWTQYQRQMASPFILAESSAVTAGELIAASRDRMRVVAATRMARSDLSRLEGEVSRIETEIHAHETYLERTESFSSALGESVGTLEDLAESLAARDSRIASLESLRDRGKTLRGSWDAWEVLETFQVPRPPDFDRAGALGSALENWQSRTLAFAQLGNVPGIGTPEISSAESLMTRFSLQENLDFILLKMPRLGEIREIPDCLTEFEHLNRFWAIVGMREAFESELIRVDRELSDIDLEIKEKIHACRNLLNDLGDCPVCGKSLETIPSP